MGNLKNKLNSFLNTTPNADDMVEGQEVCDLKAGKCYIKTKDGLIERTIIEKKLVVEDGRELLREETPISHSKRQFLR